MNLITTFLCLYIFIIPPCFSQDTVTGSNISVNAYIDFYYAFDFYNPTSGNRNMLANNSTHIFSHHRHNEFALNNGIIFLHYLSEKARGALSVHTGTFIQANYAHEPGLFRHIFEANIGVKVHDHVWVDAGIMPSHIGAESAVSMDNYTLSRSVMADNTPYYQSGVKLTYAKNNKYTASFLVLNGWQNIVENNTNKAIGSHLQYAPNKELVFNSGTFIGKERPLFDSVSTTRLFHNFFLKYKKRKLGVIAAFDIGFQKHRQLHQFVKWYNVNVIMKYHLLPGIAVAARAEYYHDHYGTIINTGHPGGFKTISPSVNVDVYISKTLQWRIEGRVFAAGNGIYKKDSARTHKSGFLLTSLSMKL